MIVTEAHELEGLKEIGQIVARVRDLLKNAAEPGITTKEMDEMAGRMLAECGAKSAPITEYDFPGYTCISINEEVAHGIPGSRKIQENDLVNVDVSAVKNGFYADCGISFVVGEGTEAKQKLCQTAKDAFAAGIARAHAGGKKANIGKAIEALARQRGYQVIRNLTGHGIGRSLHEEPHHILNYYDPWDSELLKDGTVLAVEPFIAERVRNVINNGSDEWTFITPDKSFVAQYEHTIVVTKGEPIILTLTE